MLSCCLGKIFIDLAAAAELYDWAGCSIQLLPPEGSKCLVICKSTNMQNDPCKRVLLTTGASSEKHHFMEMADSFQINTISWHQSSAICKCSVHMAPTCTTSTIPTPPTCVNKTPPNIFTDECRGKRLGRHEDESQPGEKTEERLQRWNITGRDNWRRDGEREADGELDWWDQLTDKLVMNASAGGGKQEGYESELEEEWMRRARKTDWWRKLELMESHCGKSSWFRL